MLKISKIDKEDILMPRGRRKVAEKDYAMLISASEAKIQKLTSELKEEKANLKQLKKDQIVYDEMMEQKKKQDRLKKIAELIETSGKSIDEIEALLSKSSETVPVQEKSVEETSSVSESEKSE